jgi:hypothetical protein
MSVDYSQAAITARLQGVINAVGASGLLKLNHGASPLSTIVLATPCGFTAGGVLTFTGGSMDSAAAGTGNCDNAVITNALGNPMISNMTVGIPGTGANVIIVNGVNTPHITLGQAVQFVAGTIIGA